MLGRKNKKQQQSAPRVVQQPGRLNAPVFSYHSSRSTDARNIGRTAETLEVKRSLPKPDFRYIPTWISLAAIIVSALYSLTLVTDAHVAIVQPSSSLTRPNATYHQAASDILQGTIWSRTKPTINTETVANQLQQQFPEIEHIAVTVPLIGRRPVIAIQTAEPAFLLASTKSGAYYVDNDGRAMVKATEISKPLANVIIVRDQSGIPVEPNKPILPKDTVEFITTIINQLKAKNIAIDSFELPATPFEVRLKVKDKPYYVRFNTEADGREQAGTYLAVDARLTGDNVTPKEYIDVRVPERAYYK